MPMTLSVSDDGKFIIQKVTGDMSREMAMEYNRETHALGAKLGVRRYLVDMTESRNIDSITDKYEFAYRDMKAGGDIDMKARVALLVSPDEHSHDFIEIVSRNAGMDVTLFRDRKEAEEHLRKE